MGPRHRPLVRLAAGTTYTTNFAGTENPISEGGKWVNGKAVGLSWNNVQTIPGRAFAAAFVGGASRYDDPIAHLNTSFAANQFAQGTVYRVPGYRNASDKHEIELLLRFQITANSARGYEVLWGQDGEIVVVRWNGPLGSYTVLGGIPDSPSNMAVDGDVLRVEIIGSVVRVYRNGSLVVTGASDSTFTNGQPGHWFLADRGIDLGQLRLEELSSGQSVRLPPRIGTVVGCSKVFAQCRRWRAEERPRRTTSTSVGRSSWFSLPWTIDQNGATTKASYRWTWTQRSPQSPMPTTCRQL